ncbi:hypothetical protein ES708_06135 [subsurface metagenome]
MSDPSRKNRPKGAERIKGQRMMRFEIWKNTGRWPQRVRVITARNTADARRIVKEEYPDTREAEFFIRVVRSSHLRW